MDASQRTRQPARTPSAPAAATFRSRLDELEGTVKRLSRLVAITSTNETSGKPISDRIHDLLRANQDMSFSPAEIMECIHVGEERVEAVRKALQRLCARDIVVRVGHAEYRINMPPSEGLPP